MYKTTVSFEGRELSVLIQQNGERSSMWIAYTLEAEMITHGPTPKHALWAMREVVKLRGEFNKKHRMEPFSDLRKAPDLLFEYHGSSDCEELSESL